VGFQVANVADDANPCEIMGSRPMAQFSLIPSGEATELGDDVRRLFDDLARTVPREHRVFSGECHPSLDVLETDDAVEITLDVAGIPIEALRVLFRAGVLLIVGEKAPGPGSSEQTYHLVEREFGRFARAVRLEGAFNVTDARATLRDGELIIVLPKIVDRRGSPHPIEVTSATEPRT
jgi:HSP20 family protein